MLEGPNLRLNLLRIASAISRYTNPTIIKKASKINIHHTGPINGKLSENPKAPASLQKKKKKYG